MFLATIIAAPLIITAPLLQKAEPIAPAGDYCHKAMLSKDALPTREEILRVWGLSDIA